MKKVAITGASGLVGSRIVELLKNDFEFLPLSSKDMDITNVDSVNSSLNRINVDLLLHLAAYTNVDGAEKEPDLAYSINVNGTKNVFDAVKNKNAQFIYISTADFVFDGINPPFFEDSTPNPLGQYGKTKLEGEKIVGSEGMIVRFQNPYGNSPAEKKDFARILKSLLSQSKTLQMVTDSLITPTFIDDIVYGLKYLMNNYSKEIFHLVGSSSLSPYDAGKLIAKTFHFDESLVQPTTYAAYFAGKALRPQWAEVKSKKNNFFKMKSFEEGLHTLA